MHQIVVAILRRLRAPFPQGKLALIRVPENRPLFCEKSISTAFPL